jgi:hypothetical protein
MNQMTASQKITSYEPDSSTPTQIWTALQDIMQSALAYSHRKLSPTAKSAFLADCARLKWLDDTICARLHQAGNIKQYLQPSQSPYVLADQELQDNLLFSNSYLGQSYQEKFRINASIYAELDRQRTALGGDLELEQLFVEKLALLQERQYISDQGVDITAWINYYAQRKCDYLRSLEADYYPNPEAFVFKAKASNQLLNGSDLLLAFPEQIWHREPVHLLATEGDKNYDDTKEALRKVSDELAAEVKKMNAVSSSEEREKYVARYVTLAEKRTAYTHLLKAQYEKTSYLKGWAEQSKAFVVGNVDNKMGALKAGGLAMWAATGVELLAIGIALKDGKEVDAGRALKTALNSVVVLASVGVATLLLGPLGTAIATPIVSYFFKQPDPLDLALTELKEELNKTINDGFKKVNEKLEVMDSKLDSLGNMLKQSLAKQNELSEQLANAVKEIIGHNELDNKLTIFRTEVREVDRLLETIKHTHTNLFESSSQQRLNEAMLLDLDEKIQSAIMSLAHLLYQPAATKDKAPPSISSVIIDFYERPGANFQPFARVCDDLLTLCQYVQWLTQRYLDLRPKLQQILAVIAVHHVVVNPATKKELQAELLRQSIDEGEVHGKFFANVMTLDSQLLGSNNHALYLTLASYLNPSCPKNSFTMERGFGLLHSTDLTQQWVIDGWQPATAWLKAAPAKPRPACYYVAPLSQAPPNQNLRYQLVNFQEMGNTPARLWVRMALTRNDQVRLYPDRQPAASTQPPTELLARVVPLTDPVFADTFEQFLVKGASLSVVDLPTHPVDLALPRANAVLALHALPPRERWQLEPDFSPRLYNGALEDNLRPTTVVPSVTATGQRVQPLLQPNSVGFQVLWQLGNPPKVLRTIYDLSQLPDYALWTSEQAVGLFRPAFPQAAYPADRLPFRNVLLPGEELESLRSPNGQHWLQFYQAAGSLPVLCYYTLEAPNTPRGSVFESYAFKHLNDTVQAVLQPDGNFVLNGTAAGGETYQVAALSAAGLTPKPGSSLRLENDGRLLLVSLSGFVLHTFWPHPLKITANNYASYWRTGQLIEEGAQIRSPNGKYRVQLEKYRGRSSAVFLDLYQPISISIQERGVQLRRYTLISGAEVPSGDWHEELSLVAPVEHNITPYTEYDTYYWKTCSPDMVSHISSLLPADGTKVLLDFREQGHVRAQIIARQLKRDYDNPKKFTQYFGEREVGQLPQAGTKADLYLVLADDGSLRLCDQANDRELVTLLNPVS